MSIRSMTGFGLAEGPGSLGTYRVEIKGVNNRFLELSLRQPKFMANLEQRIKKEITSVIARGSVFVTVSCDREDDNVCLTWQKESVDNYMQIFQEIQSTYNLDTTIKLSDLFHFSDIIKSKAIDVDDEVVWEQLKPVLCEAIEKFQQSRQVEGEFTANELRKLNQQISNTLDLVEKRAPVRITEYAASLEERIKKLIANPPDPLRMETEIALFADRLDISEECMRLRAHIAKFNSDLESNEPVGKRIGFLLQEMNRESNTIGSKANDMEVSHLSVLLKEDIEKIREQIQNIE